MYAAGTVCNENERDYAERSCCDLSGSSGGKFYITIKTIRRFMMRRIIKLKTDNLEKSGL